MKLVLGHDRVSLGRKSMVFSSHHRQLLTSLQHIIRTCGNPGSTAPKGQGAHVDIEMLI
jgi:hypothetical protein